MANETKKEALIIPEVMGQMIEAELPHALVFSALLDIDNALQGVPGDTKTVPKWGLIGEAEDVKEMEAIPYEKLSTSKAKVTIKKVGKGVQLSDEAILSGYGDPIGQAVKQLTTAIARKIDKDSLAELDKAKLEFDLKTKPLTYDVVADALVKFGEKIDDPKIMFITPEQYRDLRKNPNFLALKDMVGKPIMMSGVVGEICGVQLKVTSNPAIVKGETVLNYIVEPKSLGLLLKRQAEVEKARDIDTKSTKVNADMHYGVYIKDDSKVLKLITKKPEDVKAE